MRISDWSSDVCSSDLRAPSGRPPPACGGRPFARNPALPAEAGAAHHARLAAAEGRADRDAGAVADRAQVAHGQGRPAVLADQSHADQVAAGQAEYGRPTWREGVVRFG